MKNKNLLEKYAILRDFLKNIEHEKLDGISKIVVFGSVTRNKATSESDIDIIVLLKSGNVAVKEKVRRVAYAAMEESGFKQLISLHFMEEDLFLTLLKAGYSFEKEVELKGIQLWQAA